MHVLFTDPVFLEHETGPHPESPERLRAVTRMLAESETLRGWDVRSPRAVTPGELCRVHPEAYVARILALAGGAGALPVAPGSGVVLLRRGEAFV